MSRPSLACAILVVGLVAGSCAPYEIDCEDLFDVLDTDGGLTLTEVEHPVGWGEDRCFTCHSRERIHILNCTGLDEVDLAEVRAKVDEAGVDACAECHGENGVAP